MRHPSTATALRRWYIITSLALVVALGVWLVSAPADAQGTSQFTVVIESDVPDVSPGDGVCTTAVTQPVFRGCSLRAAIQEANATPGAAIITLPAGTYPVAWGGSGDNIAAVGDLDVTGSLTITGVGATTTTIQSTIGDRIFQLHGASLELIGLTIQDGSADTRGGGILVSGPTSSLSLVDSVVRLNRTFEGGGGGIWNDGGLVVLTRTIVGTNVAVGGGGGLGQSSGTTIVQDSRFVGNTTESQPIGGGSGFTGGGGILNFGGVLTVLDSEILSNRALGTGLERGIGGGILSTFGSATEIGRTWVANNTASLAGGLGILGQGRMIESTVSSNSASNELGGGVWADGLFAIENSTISANSGGIMSNSGPLDLKHVSIVGNSGPGLAANQSAVATSHSMIADNAPTDCFLSISSLTESGPNLDSDDSCSFDSALGLSGLDPILGPLMDNGGPTPTHALLLGSPAINVGSGSSGLATDQRGLPRDGRPDLGAFEFQDEDTDGDGLLETDEFALGTDPLLADTDGDGLTDGNEVDTGTDPLDPNDPPPPPPPPELAVLTPALVTGFNVVVFPGENGTPVEDVAAAVGSDLETIFRYDPVAPGWDSYSPDAAIPALNTLSQVNQRDVLFLLIAEGSAASLTWPDLLFAEPVSLDLLPGFTFVGFTGADGTQLADLLSSLPPDVKTVFRFEPNDQQYGGFLRGQPPFISDFTSADRLDALLIVNDGAPTSLEWLQVGRPRLPAALLQVEEAVGVGDSNQFFVPALLQLVEQIAVSDSNQFFLPALLQLLESIGVDDAPLIQLAAMAQSLSYVGAPTTVTNNPNPTAPGTNESTSAADAGIRRSDPIVAASAAAFVVVLAIGMRWRHRYAVSGGSSPQPSGSRINRKRLLERIRRRRSR